MPAAGHVGTDRQLFRKSEGTPLFGAGTRADVRANTSADQQPKGASADGAVILGLVARMRVGSEESERDCTNSGTDYAGA